MDLLMGLFGTFQSDFIKTLCRVEEVVTSRICLKVVLEETFAVSYW